MAAPGYNPMRWSCDKHGCYNIKHRPKIEVFADIWPGRMSMGDVDGIIEISGNALMLEWKWKKMLIKRGQEIMYRRITRNSALTVFCVEGDAETMQIAAYKAFYKGHESVWRSGDLDSLREHFKGWCAWAQSNPRIA